MNEASVHTDMIITLLVGTVIFLLLVGFIVTFLLVYQKRRARHRQVVRELTLSFEHEILKTQLEIQEQTLQTVSEDIHDNIGQILTLAKLNLAGATTDPEAMKAQRAAARQLIGKAIADLRDVSKSLSTEKISQIGLPKAIELQLAILNRTGQLATAFSVSGDAITFPVAQELTLFRIFQELMNNTIKHARATRLDARLQYEAEGLRLSTSDDGCGFAPAEMGTAQAGLGLSSIKKRAGLFNGTVEIASKPAEGTTTTIFFPRDAKAHEPKG